MDSSTDRPNIIALPPIIFATTLLLGFGLHFILPITLPAPTWIRWVAAGIVLLAIVFIVSARLAFSRAGTNVNPLQPATTIVASGPFRFTRNPMYVGMTVAFAALAVATRVGWWLILLVPTLAVMHWGVVLREERYLADKFGEAYEAYRRSVRRYF